MYSFTLIAGECIKVGSYTVQLQKDTTIESLTDLKANGTLHVNDNGLCTVRDK